MAIVQLAVGFALAFLTGQHLTSRPSALAARGAVAMMSERTDEERRRALARLYPNEQLSPKDRPRSSEVQPMLADGVIAQPWGPISLVDVYGAETPLEGIFRPLADDGASELLVLRMNMPLGLLIEENGPGEFEVAEVVAEGGAYGRVQPGDILRATTCVRMAMSYPTWQVVLGGVGRPTSQKKLLELSPRPADGAPPVLFEEMMGAIQSNSAASSGGNGQVIMLVERRRASA
jgi:hypothetical protein